MVINGKIGKSTIRLKRSGEYEVKFRPHSLNRLTMTTRTDSHEKAISIANSLAEHGIGFFGPITPTTKEADQ